MTADSNASLEERIMQAILDCSDDNLRVVLMLMLGILKEIGTKIDTAMSDEKSLREMVLNGHMETHDDDHAWLSRMRPIIGRWSDTMTWAENLRIARKDGYCDFATKLMAAEAEAAGSKRRIGEDVVSHIIVAGLSVIATLLISGFVHVKMG